MSQRQSSAQLSTKHSLRLIEPNHQSLAELIFRHLQESGCETGDMIAVSSKLIALVTTEMSKYNDSDG